jgi:hypothetical protein
VSRERGGRSSVGLLRATACDVTPFDLNHCLQRNLP